MTSTQPRGNNHEVFSRIYRTTQTIEKMFRISVLRDVKADFIMSGAPNRKLMFYAITRNGVQILLFCTNCNIFKRVTPSLTRLMFWLASSRLSRRRTARSAAEPGTMIHRRGEQLHGCEFSRPRWSSIPPGGWWLRSRDERWKVRSQWNWRQRYLREINETHVFKVNDNSV